MKLYITHFKMFKKEVAKRAARVMGNVIRDPISRKDHELMQSYLKGPRQMSPQVSLFTITTCSLLNKYLPSNRHDMIVKHVSISCLLSRTKTSSRLNWIVMKIACSQKCFQTLLV